MDKRGKITLTLSADQRKDLERLKELTLMPSLASTAGMAVKRELIRQEDKQDKRKR